MSLPFNLELIDLILIVVMALALYFDIKEFRIPNKITLSAIVIGLCSGLIGNGVSGLYTSFLGAIVGLALLLIPFFLGGMGAGDVKLLTAIGAIKGVEFVLYTAAAMAIIGGLIALYYYLILKQRKMFFPYGIAIVFGALVSLSIL
ncbi:A24 family peptidase [Natranaerobius thermophilus]|uniref:Peptidase A24A prepilin type IV n=1 Tax=Natranaerobius thermophilus (strain ATCC BAA-1301 / DSM 18059 / JW/NM-WN-LF) TaxID=457570 RepID=B2A8K2_NATTJ|nr:prepilin peptidase [Natranaerobius thermophilus]ACB85886.1 peptidase A24A prepilin type IV [Natranaerobius thermophilus JW/NM-WN-LF]